MRMQPRLLLSNKDSAAELRKEVMLLMYQCLSVEHGNMYQCLSVEHGNMYQCLSVEHGNIVDVHC